MNNSPSPQEPSAQAMEPSRQELLTALDLYAAKNDMPEVWPYLSALSSEIIRFTRPLIDAHCAKLLAAERLTADAAYDEMRADRDRVERQRRVVIDELSSLRARANLADEMAGALEELLPRYAEMFVAAGLGNPLSDSRPCIDGYNAITKFKAAKAGQK